jgi:hypothetical protein
MAAPQPAAGVNALLRRAFPGAFPDVFPTVTEAAPGRVAVMTPDREGLLRLWTEGPGRPAAQASVTYALSAA